MNTVLTRWQHASLSLLILIISVAVLYTVLISPALSARNEFQERLGELQLQFTKLYQSIGRTDTLQQEIKQLKQSQPARDGFLEEKTTALAAADLQKHLNTLITSIGGNLISTQVLPENQNESIFPKVTIKVHLRSDIESLQKLLYQLRTNEPVLLLDNLLIQKRHAGRTNRRMQQGNAELEVRFDISAFVYQSGLSS